MLQQNAYSVYDLKAETFGSPFFSVNDAVAIRMFASAVRDRETPPGANPEDYALFRVGVWDADKGLLHGDAAPAPVVTGLEVRKMEDRRSA